MSLSDTSSNPTLLPRVQIESLYYTGQLNKRWCGYLLADEPDRLVVVRANGSPLWSAKGQLWLPPGPALEIYPRYEWYNIFYGHHDDPELHRYYINVALPPVLQNGTLTYIDLDLDIGINSDFSYVVYDEDEFLSHCDLWRYPPEVCERARETLDNLLDKVQQRDALFSASDRYWPLVPEHFISSTDEALFPSQEGRDNNQAGQDGGIDPSVRAAGE